MSLSTTPATTPKTSPKTRRARPEVLAPAGDAAALHAALAAGADAVYFGLREGFNARARTGNVALTDLAATVARIHRAGAQAHLAVNTLVFESELVLVERVVRAAAAAGVDALIVQDPAVAVLARAICPDLAVHASTQMTISSPEAAAFAQSLGAVRVVVPRELSVAEIRRFAVQRTSSSRCSSMARSASRGRDSVSPRRRGLDTLTAAHDLDRDQLFALLDAVPAERFTVVLHHRIPIFHTEHCVYAHLLSAGRDFRTRGRPCERHEIGLRDHQGRTHPVIVDIGGRNTVFNSELQSAAELVPALLARGVRRFRVELVRESRVETARVLSAYGDLLAGRIAPAEAIRRAQARAHYGVALAAMELSSPPPALVSRFGSQVNALSGWPS